MLLQLFHSRETLVVLKFQLKLSISSVWKEISVFQEGRKAARGKCKEWKNRVKRVFFYLKEIDSDFKSCTIYSFQIHFLPDEQAETFPICTYVVGMWVSKVWKQTCCQCLCMSFGLSSTVL